MGNYIQKLFACAVLLLPSCFQAQSTFGYPCVVNEDCDSTQLCVEGERGEVGRGGGGEGEERQI